MSKMVIFDSHEHGLFAVNPDHVVKVVAYGSSKHPHRLCLVKGGGPSYDTMHVSGSLEEIVDKLNGGRNG